MTSTGLGWKYRFSREDPHPGLVKMLRPSSNPRPKCPCGKAIDTRTRTVGECEIYKEERDVLEEEMRKIDECGTEKFGRPR